MKRMLSILIALYYLAGSAGISMNLHYCAGEIESLSIGTEADFCCCAGFEKVNTCCGDTQIVFEIEEDQELIVNNFSFSPIILAHNTTELTSTIFDKSESANWNHKDLSIPPSKPLWLLFQSPLDYA
ncbi:MAG: hypothetical protein ACI8ZO_001653 [Flavobacteriales bacterium]|jgi:hypothetical protein